MWAQSSYVGCRARARGARPKGAYREVLATRRLYGPTGHLERVEVEDAL